MANMTSETLRHYDRIGLVKPSEKDEWTKYRYYTKQDVIRLQTVHALQQMDLSLREIKEVLTFDDLEKIVAFLARAEKKADEKIAELQYSKSKIQLAKAEYEKKLQGRQDDGRMFTADFPQRVIMLSGSMEVPTLDNLWNYLSHFYDRIPPSRKEQFAFEDLAGIYTEKGTSRLFAVCIRYGESEGLKVLPGGTYLCAACTEESRDAVLEQMLKNAREQYGTEPPFIIQMIVISGILQWRYQIQIPILL